MSKFGRWSRIGRRRRPSWRRASLPWSTLVGVAPALAFALTSCSPEPPPPTPLQDHPVWTDAQAWRLGPVLARIGGLIDDDEDAAFHGIRALTRLDADHIAVGDASGTVRIFDLEGHLTKTLGGPGGGPAEFEILDLVAVGPGDTLWVGDGLRERMVAFSREGKYLADYSLVGAPSYYGSRIVGLLPGGDPVVRGLRMMRSSAPDIEGPLSPNFLEWYRYRRTEGEVIQLARGPWREEWGIRWHDQPYEGEVIFGARSHAAVLRGALVVARVPDSFVLERRDTLGTAQGSFGRTYEVRRPAPEDRKRYVERRVEAASSDGQAQDWRSYFDAIPTRAAYPAIGGLLTDRSGNLWVRETGPPSPASVGWSVFDGKDRWLGEVTLPGELEPLEIGDDYVLSVKRDELDVESVVLYRLEKGEH